jgi:hypothetical protein
MELHQHVMNGYLNMMTWNDVPINWDDPVTVKEIINHYTDAFKKASDRLRDDSEFVRFILNKCGYQLMYASERLRGDAFFVLDTINRCIGALEYVSHRLLDDSDFMKAIVEVHACAFRYASPRLRADYDFVKVALRRRGSNIQYTDFKDDEFLVHLALERPDRNLDCPGCEACCLEEPDLNVLLHCSDRLQRLLIDLAIEYDYNVPFQPVHQDNEVLIERAVRKQPHALQSASNRLKTDRDFIKKMVALHGWCLQYVKEQFADDLEVVTIAVTQDNSAIEFASERLQKELDHLLVAQIMYS